MTGVERLLDARGPVAVGTSRRYQVSGHAPSPATVIDVLRRRARAPCARVDGGERAHEVPGRLHVGEHLGVVRLLLDVVRAVAEAARYAPRTC